MSPYAWPEMISSNLLFLLHIHFPNNMNIGQMKFKCIYFCNVILFMKFMYWVLNKYEYIVCIYFHLLIVWLQFVALAICITISKGTYDMIWVILYVLKYMKCNYVVWWYIFRYCHIFKLLQKTNIKFNVEDSLGMNDIYTVDRLGCIDCYLILVATICIYFINVIIIFFLLYWPDILECNILENAIIFYVWLDIYAFNSYEIIDAVIHISQPHINLRRLLIFDTRRNISS